MIVVKINGGLGNQFFQYAVGRSLANHHQVELVLDLSWFKNAPIGNTPRDFELNKYPILARMATSDEESAFRFYHGRVLRRIPFLRRPWLHVREKHFQFDPQFLTLPDNVYLDGYWQSELYLKGIRNLLISELQPTAEPGEKNQKLLQQMEGENSVALHIRRGDYLSNPLAAQHHGVCSLSYYLQAIQLIASKVQNPCFYVFSDDLDWAKANLDLHFPVTFVGHNSGDQSFQDLRLISHCRHQIIANSSFSWWGAWLNSKPDKIVIAPKKWFLVDKNTSTLIPSDWLMI